jgi:hypothetical protein
LARGVKRRVASLTFNIQKLLWRIVTSKPSTFLTALLVVFATLFLLGGGIYNLLEQPLLAVVDAGGRIITYYPFELNRQLLIESIIVMIFYAIGFVGLVFTYQSTKYVYRARQANRLLLIGCILVVVSYILIELSLRAALS